MAAQATTVSSTLRHTGRFSTRGRTARESTSQPASNAAFTTRARRAVDRGREGVGMDDQHDRHPAEQHGLREHEPETPHPSLHVATFTILFVVT